MGLGVSASVAILFTAVILSSIVLYETLENSMDEMKDAERFERESYEKKLRSEIDIISLEDLGGGRYLVSVENTGDFQLELRRGEKFRFELLVDGFLVTENVQNDTIRVENNPGTGVLNPTEEMSFVLEGHSLRSGDIVKIAFYETCYDYSTYE